jgi:hypothetical protein
MTEDQVVITAPGIYNIPAEVYHADPVPGGSLSSTGARRLLPPGCPALYRYERDHPTRPRRHFDIGTAAHRLVLGAGPQLVRVDAPDWRTKAAQEARDDARAAGAVPLLAAEHDQVLAMAAAIRKHPVAGALFDPAHGKPEQTLIWRDGPTRVWCRVRLDWQPEPRAGRAILCDYKTTKSASPEQLAKAIYDHGYHQQGAFYLDGARALGLAEDDAAFLLVFQEKTPPYLVTIAQLDVVALRIGRIRNRRALELYRECTTTGRWPGHSDEVELLALPGWVERQYEQEMTP